MAQRVFFVIEHLPHNWHSRSILEYDIINQSRGYALFEVNYLFSVADDRTSGLTSHSSSLSFRLPDIQECPLVSRICYRPLLGPELLSVTSPAPWSLSEPVTLTLENDWRGQITLEDLAADTRYECESADISLADVRSIAVGHWKPISLIEILVVQLHYLP